MPSFKRRILIESWPAAWLALSSTVVRLKSSSTPTQADPNFYSDSYCGYIVLSHVKEEKCRPYFAFRFRNLRRGSRCGCSAGMDAEQPREI
ncbi:hypothetical protein BKA56DRAFT_238846 [Ilyonectria sp. MPI-CAGE-AT-0026]|nr:hypothetical protein BKA56DRAFT_238846 [Ilyonectria sp. MPI-CAGE-AT-0026]